MKRISFVALAVALLSGMAGVFGAMRTAPGQKRKEVSATIPKSASWSLELRALGDVADPKLALMPRLASLRPLFFLSDGVLAVNFLTREEISGLQRRDDPNRALPFRLHALFVDAGTGHMLAAQSWPSESPNIGIFPRSDGSYLLFTRERLANYAVGGKLINELALPTAKEGVDLISADASPTGKIFFLQFNTAGSTQVDCEFIPTETMKPTVAHACGLPAFVTISDREMAIVKPGDPHSHDYQVMARTFQGAWDTVCDSKIKPGCGTPHFVGERLLLLTDVNRLRVVPLGPQKQTDFVPEGSSNNFGKELDPYSAEVVEEHPGISASPDAKYLAVPIARMIGTPMGMHIDIDEVFQRVRVLDISENQWTYSLADEKQAVEKLECLALSPGVTHLAIQYKGNLQLYDLPLDPAEKH